MMLANYHTHCKFCDGNGEPEEYVKIAVKKGFTALGFSSHAPLPYKNDWTMKEKDLGVYCRTIESLKNKYKNRIQIYLGLEVDYIDNEFGPSIKNYKKYNLDYVIGSLHMIRGFSVDYLPSFKELLSKIYGGDMRALTKEYYRLLRKMCMEHFPCIIGHFDLVKMNNRGFYRETEKWYIEEIEKTLTTISESGAIVEVSTGGISRGFIESLYPSGWILQMCYEKKIPVTLNSDAHYPDKIDSHYDMAVRVLKETGYSDGLFLIDNKWQSRTFCR